MGYSVAIADPAPKGAGLRLFRIVGDAYEPELRGGSYLMVSPTDRFLYDGEYLLDFGSGAEAPYRAASRLNGTVEIWVPNPRYSGSRSILTRAEFNAAVTAIVVAEVKVKDERLIRESQRLAA